MLDPTPRRGRPVRFDLTQEERNVLRRLVLEKGSQNLAIQFLADSSFCSPRTREEILAALDHAAQRRRPPVWPTSIMRAAKVTPEEAAMFRGPKTYGEAEMVVRRDMTAILEDGTRVPLGPYAIFESDDMSLNEPFRYYDETLGQERTGRQVLCSRDVFTAAWLGASPLGRQKDAYRLEDMMDHAWDIVCQHGLPEIAWRFEKGAWENSAIDGIKLTFPAPSGITHWGGLEALFHVQHVWKSRHKGGIENGFNHLQSLLGHASESIGRKRGEFERGTRLQRKANQAEPEALAHFWHITQAADGIAAAMRLDNGKAKERRAFGRDTQTPDDLMAGATKRECPASEAWRFLPIKRELCVRKGAVECTVDHYPMPFRFRVAGVCDHFYLGTGDRVLVAFHPGKPEQGAHIFHHEIASRNRLERPWGDLLMVAPLAEDAPQICLSRAEQEHTARKAANAAVRSSFRGIMGVGRQATSKETARDGYGNSREMTTGQAPADSTPQPRQAPAANDTCDTLPTTRDRGQSNGDLLGLKASRERQLRKEAARQAARQSRQATQTACPT